MNYTQHNTMVNFIWGIADDVLRDVYVRGKYRDVILPMTVIRRLDALLEPTKDAVLRMKEHLDQAKVANQDAALCKEAGQAFYNASPFTLRRLLDNPKQLRANFEAYLNGFSANVEEILTKFKFHNQIPTLADADALGQLITKFISPDINLSPKPVLDGAGNVKLPGLDNHAMGTVFEELIRRFNEENNEEAGEHFTPRDVVRLMANLIFLPIADRIESGTYLVYDGACGTGGMLTVAEEALRDLGSKRGKEVSIHLYGQEVNPETYAITRADLLIKGEGEEAENMKFGSTLSADGFPAQSFDFMLSNPPYGKSWKTDFERMCSGDKKEMRDTRFVVDHADLSAVPPACRGDADRDTAQAGDPAFSLITRSSDGQLMFLANMLSKMKPVTPKSPLGSRIAEVHNGSSLFTGDAGQGESNARRWMLENDWVEAIIALPLNMFYNTGIATYIWVLTNNKTSARKGKVQLIDATDWFQPLRKNLGQKNCELGEEHLRRLAESFLAFEETEQSKIFPNAAFGYWKITVERPLRLRSQFSKKAIESLRFASGGEDWRRRIYDQFGTDIYERFGKIRKDIEAMLAEPETGEDEEGSETAKPKIAEKARKRLLNELTWDRDKRLLETARKLADRLGSDLYADHNVFRESFEAAVKELGLKISAAERKTIIEAVSWRDPEAPPVIKKTLKDGSVEYEPDTELRDTEQVPFLEEGGIEAFFKRECLPYVPDLPAPRPGPGVFCVYVLKCADDSFYIGQTEDFPRRMKEHDGGKVSWTGPRRPVESIHWETFSTREEALKREDELKTGFGRKWLKRELEAGRLRAASRQAGAWIDESKTRIGYEISFTRYFYKPQPLRTLDEIKADILAVEKESEGLLEKIVGADV